MCWCECLSKSPGTGLQVTISLCSHWFSELKQQPSRVIHTMSLNKTHNCLQVSYLKVASNLIRDQLHHASSIFVWSSPGKKPEYWGKLCVLKDSSWQWDEEWEISHRAKSGISHVESPSLQYKLNIFCLHFPLQERLCKISSHWQILVYSFSL